MDDNFFDEWEEEIDNAASSTSSPFVECEIGKINTREYYDLYRHKYNEYCRQREYEYGRKRRINGHWQPQDFERLINLDCKCGCKSELYVREEEQIIEDYYQQPQITYTQYIQYFFCPGCGTPNRVIGKIIKIISDCKRG